MNFSESTFLHAELQRLLKVIEAVRTSGIVAPAYCWLTESSETKANKTYTYIRLVTEKPGKKLVSKSLGKPNSKRHQEWKRAMIRREAIAELEQQLKILDILVQRQAQATKLLGQLENLLIL
ncbi:MAG: hypothetical protein HC781_19640 [Leptolyngbyaceae cyanobacterium CSU_1_4]|nr:hypothetical protein [Leptolyngbyaceae cyanobacterium CSU_1_4]